MVKGRALRGKRLRPNRHTKPLPLLHAQMPSVRDSHERGHLSKTGPCLGRVTEEDAQAEPIQNSHAHSILQQRTFFSIIPHSTGREEKSHSTLLPRRFSVSKNESPLLLEDGWGGGSGCRCQGKSWRESGWKLSLQSLECKLPY